MTASLHLGESPHPDSRLEWWFLHGRFSGPETGERFFMTSLFRFHVPGPQDPPRTAFSVLISILDPQTGRQWTSSRVDRALLDELRDRDDPRTIDPFAVPVVLDEIREYGLPREFECPAPSPVLQAEPFHFAWDDFVLAGHRSGLHLQFRDPSTGEVLSLRATAASAPLSISDAVPCSEPGEGMAYLTCPSLTVSGSAGEEPVHGDAWFDHQWGGGGWMQSPGPEPRPRGWEWLGFRLDDGSAGVVMSHWEGMDCREFARRITFRDVSGSTRISDSFEWTPSRWWTSLATRVSHPIAWSLRVPEWDLELAFAPFADDQEIRVFGSLRSIWEGAGSVSGSLGGTPVRGTGRLESQGRGYLLFDTATYLHAWAESVDREVARFLPRIIGEPDIRRYAGAPGWSYEPGSLTAMLSTPLWDLMGRDGKRWRAVFSCLLLDTLGRDPGPILDIGMVLPELLHNASLIIDDIQDASTLRRGQPAIHCRYGVDVAISAANTAYFLPLLLVLDHPVLTRDEKQAVCEAYQRQLVRAHLGQSLDLFWAHRLSPDQLDVWMADSIGPKILQTYALKTAAPVEGLAESVALLAGAGPAVRDALLRFALAFGLSFQLIDDVKNFSGARGWGKPRGEDLGAGKLTYVILRALQLLEGEDRAALREILCRRELREDPSTLARGIELVVSSGARESVCAEARERVAPAWDEFSQLVRPSCSKTELRLLWEALLASGLDPISPLAS
jgi:geranylgeranyl pyrophosphate synthase/predicted secreted hydrolase